MPTADPTVECIETMVEAFNKKKDPRRALSMSRYMKNKFEYFGIASAERKNIFKPFKSQLLQLAKQGQMDEIVCELWDYEQREMQYCALELLDAGKRMYVSETIDLIERLIMSKSWWDTVDMLAGKIAGQWFQRFPDLKIERVESWILHQDHWINRSAIIHQLMYKDKTDFELLKKSIIPHIPSQDFFLRKAIGWSLRQYSKTNPTAVFQFVQQHPDLSALSKKEALRLIPKKVT